MYSIMCLYIYIICLCIREINDSNDTRETREELGSLVITRYSLPMNQYVILKWTCISCKCILQTLGQLLKKISRTVKLRKEICLGVASVRWQNRTF